jgi:hypothetical protein
MRGESIPSERMIAGWIEKVFAQGVRRPGHPADRWAEGWIAERFAAFGLEAVRGEPVTLPRWEPRRWSLHAGGEEWPSFPLPHAAACTPLELPLVRFDPAAPERVRGAAALVDVPLLRLPYEFVAAQASFSFDPDGSFAGAAQVLPFGREFQAVMEPALAAGAAAFVGVLSHYPGDSKDYYVPYDGVARPIPGLWVRGSDGARLHELARAGARVRIEVDAERREVVDHNVVGELPGADEDLVVIGSHHDGPWASAVEDASGIALVLAQASYWARVPRAERPHRLLFLLNAGHMCHGAGARAFLEAHRAALARIVLELHLEHAAAEYEQRGGALVATGRAESRWWFTSRLSRLEAAVAAAIEAERLDRSFVVPPTIFGPQPTTDGGFFHLEGVPLVNLLAAPFYLFDAMDTLDKIHRPSLVPITRAAVRIVEATAGVSATAMRRRDDPAGSARA